MAALEDVRQGKVAMKSKQDEESRCHKHNMEGRQLYCETCQELIFQTCSVEDHSTKPQHYITGTGTAYLKHKQSLEDKFPTFKTGMKELEETLAATSQAEQEFGNKVAGILKEVQDTAARMIADVNAEKNRIIEEIESVRKDRSQAFDDHEKAVTMILQRTTHSLEKAKAVTKTAPDSEFLSLYPTISKYLESLNSQHPPEMDHDLAYLRFQQNQAEISLGTLHLQANWELCREFGQEGSGIGDYNGAHGIASPQPDEIAVADWHNKRIVISSADGNHKKTIPVQGNPRGIAAIPDQLVVLDTSSNVKIYNDDNTLASIFPTVPQSEVGKTEVDLRAVAVKKDGTIIVSDAKRNVLTEHSHAGSLIRTMPVSIRPSYVAVDSDDRVVISGGVEKVHVTDDAGADLLTIRPSIEDQQVKYSNGVCCDKSGIYMYIAVDNGENTGHIHHYDTRGRFRKCIAQGLHNPYGITFTADGQQLAVADCYSVKMYHKV